MQVYMPHIGPHRIDLQSASSIAPSGLSNTD